MSDNGRVNGKSVSIIGERITGRWAD